jgi:general stress protein 26
MHHTSPDHDDPILALGELIHGIRHAMLTTASADGTLHSRPMATLERAFDGDLYFFTGRASHKVEDIEARSQVNLAFSEPDRQRFVSVVGSAALIEDEGRKRELWSPAMTAWFPGGIDDPDLALLRVRVSQADAWTSPTSAVVRIAGFLHAVATGERTDLGRHDHLDLTNPSRV